MLWYFQVNSEGTQPSIYLYPHSQNQELLILVPLCPPFTDYFILSVLLLTISPLSWSNPFSFSSLQPLGAALSNVVVGSHVWLFILKWIKINTKKSIPQLHQLHFKPSIASGCHSGRPSSTGLMICLLLSVQGNFLSRAFGQVPPHNFSDSQCDLQASGPSSACLALYSALPCLPPCRHILHSFIPFNLSLSRIPLTVHAFSYTLQT